MLLPLYLLPVLLTLTSARQTRCVCQIPEGSDDCRVDIDTTLDDVDCGEHWVKNACSGSTAPFVGVKCRISKGLLSSTVMRIIIAIVQRQTREGACPPRKKVE
ncbi:uncharacterized protein MYCGRDRAFT_90809 [Zymoseptoria tritici IPO323]|uniref:Hydrophobin n=1 Tax=Zymoseptoria tritici (strain CBS 115943 / IPO323) TaxID=336722 RepID=F9X3S5_ZYMTI|nr:uncharacterized protein MYCGRDRAFT_90809 [Zymoseptoria tritici IPO323]EGP90491.1 hypothetical protein MYCGRDRAFT_90809 [Zymoseptoria tritici IPO323]